jgi:SHS2 domain-containing protein
MMTSKQIKGFEEIEHTADWAMHVWAPDLGELLVQSALGMYTLAQTRLDESAPVQTTFEVDARDAESLLVQFLSELLWLGESERLGFWQYELALDGFHMVAHLTGGRVMGQAKEIKAATYSNLKIKTTGKGVETTIVLDV